MCGIHLVAWKDADCECEQCKRLFSSDGNTDGNDGNDDNTTGNHQNLHRRGPDASHSIDTFHQNNAFHEIRLQASVLQMRQELHTQPVAFCPGWFKRRRRRNGAVNAIFKASSSETDTSAAASTDDDTDDVAYLCWNGEVYQTLVKNNNDNNDNTVKDVWNYESSDTAIVARLLEEAVIDDTEDDDNISTAPQPQQHVIARIISTLWNAEFAFLIATKEGVYFGRDVWGRRSLLHWTCDECGSFQIVSVAESMSSNMNGKSSVGADMTDASIDKATNSLEWTELAPGRVHFIPFAQQSSGSESFPPVVYPKVSLPPTGIPSSLLSNHNQLANNTNTNTDGSMYQASLELECHLRRAVAMRLDQSKAMSTGVLFSGGVDSVVLAALAADILQQQQQLERNDNSNDDNIPPPILHLYNVSFGPNPEKSADRAAALKSYEALREKYGRANYNNNNSNTTPTIEIIFHDIVVEWDDICQVEQHVRTLLLPKSTVMDVNIATALWFASRGHTRDLDKLNGGNASNNGNDTSQNQDPSVPNHNQDTNTVNDIRNNPRVLLLGMGADEQLGGYGRHRKAYEQGGFTKLREELRMDQDRLWERNLGRDDRLIADNSKEARFPFLDAHVVDFLKRTPLSDVCNFDLPPGQGDKRILRLIAQRLDMDHASGLVKRAIQFGSRISHVSDTKRFGSRRKAKGGN